MIDPERIQRLAAKMGNRKDALEFVRQMRCGGKKFDGGGRYYKVPTPIADGQNASNYVETQPNYSDGMFGGIDVSGFYDAMGRLRMPLPEVQAAKVEPVRVDTTPEWYNMVPLLYDVPSGFYSGISADTDGGLFSEEAKARRKVKQRYAESKFNDRAESNAGAKGAWQIMPITYKDYLGRGRGKEGDLYDAKFNEKIRDWVMGIIPRDLQEFWSDDDSDINKLAKLYAAYNWGAGSLRNFFRKRLNAGLSNDDPYEWVEGLNPETKRYVKYLAFDEDFDEGTGYTTKQFEDAAKARGYMAEGGRLFRDGGDEDGIYLGELQPAVKLAYEPLHVDTPYTTDDFFERWYPNRRAQLIDNMAAIRSRHVAWPFSSKKRAEKDVDGYIKSVLANNSNVKEFGVPIIGAYGSNNKFPNAFNNEEARKVLSDHLESKYRFIGKEIPEGGFDNFDLAFLEMGNAYGKSYKDNPYYIFYDRGNPSFETIVHERSHVLRPLPEDLKKYRDYRYFGNPMERKVDDIKRDLVHTDFWSGKIDKSWANSEGVDKVKDDISYLSSIEEIVARLNAIRAEQNLNPNHVITKEDLDEIRKNADEATRREFLDLYTDEALLRFFNEVADAGNQESLYGNHLGNVSASGGKIRIKPENRGKFNALKKRTGHSASWFKAHGTPAQKKMATFALNSKHWSHKRADGGYLDNYFYDGGPYSVIPLGGDYLNYLQSIPEVSGRTLDPSVVTASLPAKFNGSQEAAARYAEGYQKGARPVSEAMNRAGQDIFNTVDTVVGLTPTPAGAITWIGHMGADAANGEYGKVGKDLAMAAAMGLGLNFAGRALKPIISSLDDIERLGYNSSIFNDLAYDLSHSSRGVNMNFRYDVPASARAVPVVANVVNAAQKAETVPYAIADLGGGYMLKSLMRGNPLEKQISKNGTVNVNNVRALVGKGSKVEQAVVDKVLASEEFSGKKSIDYNKFRKAVQDELISYERSGNWIGNQVYADYGMNRIGFIVEPDEASSSLPGVVKGAKTDVILYESPRIPDGSAKHYNDNTLGHSRTYITEDEPDVLHVMESQSDWAQNYKPIRHDGVGGYANTKEYNDKRMAVLQKRIERLTNDIADEERRLSLSKRIDGSTIEHDWEKQQLREIIERDKKSLESAKSELYVRQSPSESKQHDYLADNYTSRQIQENLRYAAEKGQTKMRYPTRETAAKIEGYDKVVDRAALDKIAAEQERDMFVLKESTKYDDWYDELRDLNDRWGNLTHKEQERLDYLLKKDDEYMAEVRKISQKAMEEKQKLFRTSTSYSPEHEGILKKYDAFPKQYQKLYKGADVRTVTDSKGNTWYEVDVPENYLQQEWAYEEGGSMILPKMMMDKHSPDKLRKAIASIKAKRMK